MDRPGPAPWNPDRAWADPFIATLALLILLLGGWNLKARRLHAQAPAHSVQVSLQGRLADLALAAPRLLGATTGAAMAGRDPKAGLSRLTGWDQAVVAVYAGDQGDLPRGETLAAGAPGPFPAVWAWAYADRGPAPDPEALRRVRQGLGSGYAAGLLEARVASRQGGDPKPILGRAQDWALPRLMALVATGLAGLLLILGGLAFMLYLTLSRPAPRPALTYGMSGRAVLIVLLGWFLALLCAGQAVQFLLMALPFLRPLALPLTYGLHAALGVRLLCLAEGLTLGELWARLSPAPHGRALLAGLGFLALAATLVTAMAMALSPFLHTTEPPQRELMEAFSRLRGPVALTLTFLTVAGLAPAFEELMFRGFLLPWLGERLARRLGPRAWHLAVAATALTFAAMHLQPMGMPTLATLGVVLGLAFLRTGDLLTSILVHGIWNGAIFLVLRLVA